MSFDYLAYAMPTELIQTLRKYPEEFLNIFYESNYAEEFDEVQDEYNEDVEKIGAASAKKLYEYVQFLLENEDQTLDLDGEYWAAPTHFFLTGEFDEEEVLPQPPFTIKREANRLLINALGCTDSVQTEESMILFTSAEQAAEIAKTLPELLEEDFKKRWNELCTQTGQFTDAFEEAQDLDEFIADLREFMHEVLIPFYQNLANKKMGVVVMFD